MWDTSGTDRYWQRARQTESIHRQLKPHCMNPPSNHKVNTDPAFNPASHTNQTRCSEQWLMRVSQFPPIMSATLVVTQFVSIICSLESPLAALVCMFLFQNEHHPTAARWVGTQQKADEAPFSDHTSWFQVWGLLLFLSTLLASFQSPVQKMASSCFVL